MTSASTIRNIFMIATCIFMVTMATVFFLIGEDKLNIEKDDLKNAILFAPDADGPQSEELYRDLLNNEEDEILIIKDNATLEFITDDLLTQLEYSSEDVLNKNLFSLIHPKDLPELGNNFVKNFNEESMVMQENIGPVRLKTNTGSYVPYLISLVPLNNDSGERVSTAILLTDLSTPIGEDEKDMHEIAAEEKANPNKVKVKTNKTKK